MDFLLRPAKPADENSVVTLQPAPGFVLKSKLVSAQNRPKSLLPLQPNTKIFINVCHDDRVPKPDVDFNPSIVYPLIMENQWEIPIITSSVRSDKDKKGALCYVWDCCINTKCMEWVSSNVQLREILVEWCLESCELADMIEISRENVAFPRMKNKGEFIPALEILQDSLQNDYKKDIAVYTEAEQNDPANILKLQRDLLIEDADNSLLGSKDEQLPPLFPPVHLSDSNKPLIQEIDDLTIHDTKKKKAGPHKEVSDVHFEVNIRKTKNPNSFRLKIEVKSEINSCSDLKVQYQPDENCLIVKSTNLNKYREKKLDIPLPNIFTEEDGASMQCFFVKNEKKLVIFI